MPALADERRIVAGDAGGRVQILLLGEPGACGAAKAKAWRSRRRPGATPELPWGDFAPLRSALLSSAPLMAAWLRFAPLRFASPSRCQFVAARASWYSALPARQVPAGLPALAGGARPQPPMRPGRRGAAVGRVWRLRR